MLCKLKIHGHQCLRWRVCERQTSMGLCRRHGDFRMVRNCIDSKSNCMLTNISHSPRTQG